MAAVQWDVRPSERGSSGNGSWGGCSIRFVVGVVGAVGVSDRRTSIKSSSRSGRMMTFRARCLSSQ